jgi:hypothetical protein
MDYAPGFDQYQTPETWLDKLKRAVITVAPTILKIGVNIVYWVVKLVRDFLKDAFNSVLGR